MRSTTAVAPARHENGRLLQRGGISAVVAGVLLGYASRTLPDENVLAISVVWMVQLLLLFGGAFAVWRGRQYVARARATAVLHDDRADVLYLRPFATDPSLWRYILSAKLLSGLYTEEEQLAEALEPFGDLVAIGQPGEALPVPGAARLYAPDVEWKRVVASQMLLATLVVIRAGTGKGFLWELRKAATLVERRRLLILLLGLKRRDYDRFADHARRIFECDIPAAKQIQRFGRFSGFLRFRADGTPEFLPLRRPFLRSSPYKSYTQQFTLALRPVFEEFGVPWIAPSVAGHVFLASALVVAVALLIAGVIWTSF